jgi:hypothetical protein
VRRKTKKREKQKRGIKRWEEARKIVREREIE